MSRRPIWEEIYNRFDPFQPAAEQARRADRPRSPAADIIKLLQAPFEGTRALVTGTTGTGKSTELLRIAEARSRHDFVVVLDLQRHFSDVVGDEQALQDISSWEVVFLAGLAVARAAKELLPYPLPDQHLEELARAWQKAAKAADTPAPPAQLDLGAVAKTMVVLASAAAPLAAPATAAAAAGTTAGLELLSAATKVADAATGALKWQLPIGRSQRRLPDQDEHAQNLLGAVNVLVGYVQSKLRRVLLVIDGLDRILEFERAEALFLRSELIAQIACRMVVAGPFALHSHPAKGAIPRFSKNCVVFNEPVMQKGTESEPGPGVGFFCDVFRRRTADLGVPDLVPNDLLERLAYFSGGRVRDFVKLVRALAEQGWVDDAMHATQPLVDRVLDEMRRLLETGLDAGHVEVLERAAADPRRLIPADPRARELLDYGKLLPYPNESEWYFPHPLLTMHLVRTTRPGSHG
ncbi:hypothetical protein WMF31_20885 [Sorangium sp. So ce1036]|uniref:hypothetical protein n=1 Tax=Sorangium sp. So ce1036 TaxID=3133328 RepID=UPI003F0B5502